MTVENTLAYYNTATITVVKFFIVQAPEVPGTELTTLHFLCNVRMGPISQSDTLNKA
jgi:hypothetical protein